MRFSNNICPVSARPSIYTFRALFFVLFGSSPDIFRLKTKGWPEKPEEHMVNTAHTSSSRVSDTESQQRKSTREMCEISSTLLLATTAAAQEACGKRERNCFKMFNLPFGKNFQIYLNRPNIYTGYCKFFFFHSCDRRFQQFRLVVCF